MFKRGFFPSTFFAKLVGGVAKPESKGRDYQKKKRILFPHFNSAISLFSWVFK